MIGDTRDSVEHKRLQSVLIKSKRWLKLAYRYKADVPLVLVYYFAISQAIGRFITLTKLGHQH